MEEFWKDFDLFDLQGNWKVCGSKGSGKVMRSPVALFYERHYNVLKDYFGNLVSFCLWVSHRRDLVELIENNVSNALSLVLERRSIYLGKKGKTVIFERLKVV